MLTVGIFCILEAKGVVVSDFVTNNLSQFSYDTLIIAGSCFIAGSVLLALLVCCLRSRIAIGAKAVQLGSMFILNNCFLVILPITQGCFVIITLAGFIAGGISLLSLGTYSFPNDQPFPSIALSGGQIVAVIIFIVVGLWLIFFFNGCNHFMISSGSSVWYFVSMNGGDGAPCGDSLWRMVRFHIGSVTFTSFVNGFFFVIKMLANLFSFSTN